MMPPVWLHARMFVRFVPPITADYGALCDTGNPLSAVLQLGDTIISSLGNCKKYFESCNVQLEEEVIAAIDSAQTILLCANHQKRVVEDILTLSKLDSARLIITPVDVQPVAVINEAIKIFEQECSLHEINMDLEVLVRY